MVASARGGSPLTKQCSWKLVAAWVFNVAVLACSTGLVAWFLLLQARLTEGLGTRPVEKRRSSSGALSPDADGSDTCKGARFPSFCAPTGVDNARYAGAVMRTYAASLVIGLIGKDVAQCVLVALLPVKSGRSRKGVAMFASAVRSLIEAI